MIEADPRAARTVEGVRGVEKCFARKTGLKYHVDLHLEVDPDMTVRRSHELGHEVRERILDALPWVADVLVHVEPAPLPARPEVPSNAMLPVRLRLQS